MIRKLPILSVASVKEREKSKLRRSVLYEKFEYPITFKGSEILQIPDEKQILALATTDAKREKLIKIVSHEILVRTYALNDYSIPGLYELLNELTNAQSTNSDLLEVK